ncbi:monoamine oxidase [Tistlia consotensis]|uniref:Tryptophan 2-monooxygenase n=1 Tax=Tistlia consotensis USBA 355 TaxID=560819 RepID=A0A1Y6CMK4_9PROT|nr:NAD(P)/FAD-dependent oxidoreductase [Tistlia consotensis]SMF63430.1 monoamine oxidase [Tistlia consotensis USBA 355]SNR96213.1 monoamine oxidase [Tistlia consotensis]
MTRDVVVIGAGAAGIAAARRLAELGLSFALLEARGRVGGRAASDNETFGAPFDLGCHWLHSPAHNPLKAEADALGIRYLGHGQEGRYARDGRLLDAGEQAVCDAYLSACLERVAAAGREGRDCAVSALFDGADGRHPIFEAEFTAKQGVPPEQGSTLDFARYLWVGEDLPVIGGLGNLVARLAEGLPVSLDTPVSRVRQGGAGALGVETARGTLEARSVIVTVSTGVLRSDAIRFEPGLPDWKRAALEGLPMGSCNKVALGFRRRPDLPADCEVMPLRGAAEPVELVLRPGGRDLAVAMVSGPFGKALAEAGAAAMADYALDRLVELFGSGLREAVGPARAVAAWDLDPWVRGYVSAALPGRADARLDLARPVDDRLFFAGEATSLQFMGDVHGAWLSGIEAAEAAARALGVVTAR